MKNLIDESTNSWIFLVMIGLKSFHNLSFNIAIKVLQNVSVSHDLHNQPIQFQKKSKRSLNFLPFHD